MDSEPTSANADRNVTPKIYNLICANKDCKKKNFTSTNKRQLTCCAACRQKAFRLRHAAIIRELQGYGCGIERAANLLIASGYAEEAEGLMESARRIANL